MARRSPPALAPQYPALPTTLTAEVADLAQVGPDPQGHGDPDCSEDGASGGHRRQGAAEEDAEGESEGGIAHGDDTARAEHHRVDPREEGVRGVGSAAAHGLVDRAAPPGHREAGQSGDGHGGESGEAELGRERSRPSLAPGLRVMASAPLHGGELPGMVDQELADLIRPGLTPAQACVLAVASCPGVTNVLLAASGAPHWREAADAVAQPSLTAAQLREITGVLASP
ncbi:hypothetical protein ACFXKC_49085 [Streptomyces sp. NPDC059340]|uniref:hypothetical protein n=1 Tax=Streptomyces sp. NPDC059340 TaxID=3346806 RepID=UPI0036C92460